MEQYFTDSNIYLFNSCLKLDVSAAFWDNQVTFIALQVNQDDNNQSIVRFPLSYSFTNFSTHLLNLRLCDFFILITPLEMFTQRGVSTLLCFARGLDPYTPCLRVKLKKFKRMTYSPLISISELFFLCIKTITFNEVGNSCWEDDFCIS